MKLNSLTLLAVLTAALLSACGDSALDVEPKGVLTEDQVTIGDNVEGLVTATYAWLGNDHYTAPNFLWPTGNLRAGDAHKGGNGPGDIFSYHVLSLYEPVIADMRTFPPDLIDLNNKKWVRNFTGISRANLALRSLAEADFPLKQTRIAEVRFLRAFWYFDLKIHHKRIPFVDETVPSNEILNVSNVALSDQQVWDRIADDLRFAADNLPDTQPEIGRANKFTAKAFLAKVLLYAAYEQDDTHAVVNIDAAKLNEVVTLVDEIEASGQYGLNPDYATNFRFVGDNSMESVFAIQRSIDDGTPDGKGSFPTALNGPQAALDVFYGCCGFHVPTDNFVNAFKTNANGLPMFNTFNDQNLGMMDTVDPRLDHTVVAEGQPFKYSNDIHGGDAWARFPAVYGNFLAQKDLEHPDCGCLAKNGLEDFKPFTISAMNTPIIRYADVLLFKAEALIELGRQDEALPIINQIRTRAANSTGLLNGFRTYNVGTYAAFASQDEARQALRFERRLELGLEGSRFFDLVRWGIAKQTIDTYLAVEQTRKAYLADAVFTSGRDEYMPIPQEQINLSGGLYEQNPGY